MKTIDYGTYWERHNDNGSITIIEAHICRRCKRRIEEAKGERPSVSHFGVEHLNPLDCKKGEK